MKKGQIFGRLVTIQYGVPKVSQKLAEFMASIKAKQTTRYALDCVGFTENALAVTDGRRLLAVTLKDTFDPPIEEGCYHLTGEGFLLKTDEKNFPKWRDSIPKENVILGDFTLADRHGEGLNKAIVAILGGSCTLNIEWLWKALTGFHDCGCDMITVKDPGGNNPTLITGEAAGAELLYLQMPLSNPDTDNG